MKRFLRDILFTFLFCLSLIVVLEIAIGKTQTSYSYKDWYMTEHADKIKILLLGSSFFENSFDPHILGDSVFDGASTARELWYDVQILKKYASKMHNLRTVIIPLNAANPSAGPPVDKAARFPYARYMGITCGKTPLQYSALFSERFTFRDLIPIKISKRVKDCKNYNQDLYMDSLGYSPLYFYWDGKGKNEADSVTFFGNPYPLQKKYTDCLSELAKYCYENNIRLIFVIPPCGDTFESGKICSLKLGLYELSKTHHFEYEFYHDAPAFRADSLYSEVLHLNHIGATLFARRVKEDFNL